MAIVYECRAAASSEEFDVVSNKVHPVILSGGSGSRLWPVSRSSFPKQFHSLTSEQSLLQQTVARVSGDRYRAPTVICSAEQRFIATGQVRGLSTENTVVVVEPIPRNTAPAITIAALTVERNNPDDILLVLPSDHVVIGTQAFEQAVSRAVDAARAGTIVTFGVPPDHPSTGFGYIKRGEPLAGLSDCYGISRFIEKPCQEVALQLVDEGGYYWNSGMFVFQARTFLAEVERLQPELLRHCRRALEAAQHAGGAIVLDEEALARAPSISVDYAVMEHTTLASVVPVDFGWSDVGSWTALWDLGDKDEAGNVRIGDVVSSGNENSYIRSDGPLVAAIGCKDLIIVATDDAVLITDKHRAQDVRDVVVRLQEEGRTEGSSHSLVHRPWGTFEPIANGHRYKVKHILVHPGGRLSLQMHHHRAEHWIVVAGMAKIVIGDQTSFLHENQSIYIPAGVVHRLENPGRIPLEIIEVQSGAYLEEDDIVRVEDVYGRT